MRALLFACATIGGLFVIADAPTPLFVFVVVSASFGLAPFVGNSLAWHVPVGVWSRFNLSPQTSRRLGIKCFNDMLTRIGWNKRVFEMRGDDSWNPWHMQSAALGHGWAFLLYIGAALWCSLNAAWFCCLILMFLGVLLHLYPVLLQIYVLTQLRRGTIGTQNTAKRPTT